MKIVNQIADRENGCFRIRVNTSGYHDYLSNQLQTYLDERQKDIDCFSSASNLHSFNPFFSLNDWNDKVVQQMTYNMLTPEMIDHINCNEEQNVTESDESDESDEEDESDEDEVTPAVRITYTRTLDGRGIKSIAGKRPVGLKRPPVGLKRPLVIQKRGKVSRNQRITNKSTPRKKKVCSEKNTWSVTEARAELRTKYRMRIIGKKKWSEIRDELETGGHRCFLTIEKRKHNSKGRGQLNIFTDGTMAYLFDECPSGISFENGAKPKIVLLGERYGTGAKDFVSLNQFANGYNIPCGNSGQKNGKEFWFGKNWQSNEDYIKYERVVENGEDIDDVEEYENVGNDNYHNHNHNHHHNHRHLYDVYNDDNNDNNDNDNDNDNQTDD